MVKKLYSMARSTVHTPYAQPCLALFSFLESIIFPPAAPLLILCCLEDRKRVYRYAFIATGCSVVGGIVAYYCGYALWATVGQKLIHFFSTPQAFTQLCTLYQQYESVAILIGSFLPFPYKIISLTAGFCHIAVTPFVIYSCIGRASRCYLVAFAIQVWGDWLTAFIDRWFIQLVALFLLLITAGFLVVFMHNALS